MGTGMRLAIPRQAIGHARLLRDPRYSPISTFREVIRLEIEADVPERVVKELQDRGLIWELTEFGEGNRIGWREAGLPGESYRLYVCTQ